MKDRAGMSQIGVKADTTYGLLDDSVADKLPIDSVWCGATMRDHWHEF